MLPFWTLNFTSRYKKLLDSTLHHNPRASDEDAGPRSRRLAAMESLYAAFFSTTPLRSGPPQGPFTFYRPSEHALIHIQLPSAKSGSTHTPFAEHGLMCGSGTQLTSVEPQSSIEIHIELLTGKTYTALVYSQCTIGQLKFHIRDIVGWSPDLQRLIFARKLLEDDNKTLEDYGVENGSLLYLINNVREECQLRAPRRSSIHFC